MKRTYEMNENFFEVIDTEEKAYWLGFLYADGYNYEAKGEIKVRLAIEDEDFLLKFRNLIYPNKDKPLYYLNRYGVCKSCELNISSVLMSRQLAAQGCMQAKTFKITFPHFLNKSLYRHFIRGVFDGDGSLSISTMKNGLDKGQKKVQFSITGYRNFLSEVNKIIAQQCGLNENKLIDYKRKDPRVAGLIFSGRKQCIKIKEYLYKDATIFMQRKYEKFLRLETDEFKSHAEHRVNLYSRTIKINPNCFIDPIEHSNTNFLICCNCNKMINYTHKIYDKDKKIYCCKCYSDLFGISRICHKNSITILQKQKDNNVLKDKDSFVSILKIKDVNVYFDSEDIEVVKQYKWHIENGRVVSRIRKPKKCIYLNRLLLNAKEGQSVAFKDGNCFNLRKENLELREHR